MPTQNPIAADYDCEECHATEGETVYNQMLSDKRLCRPCYVKLGGSSDYARAERTVEIPTPAELTPESQAEVPRSHRL